VPGRVLDGVVLAMDYLVDQNVGARRFDVRGKRVVILGGGDTGSDCLGTALRQGASEVTQIELLPQPPEARAAANPWPAWPMVFRTSSSQQEGGTRAFSFRTTRLEGEGGNLTALVGERVDSPGEEVRIATDVLILALGFTGADTSELVAQFGIAVDARGNVIADRGRTSVAGLYAAGDAHLGASLIVWAIAEGRTAAAAVHADLSR
jgi:glutamate synthase (NADPH/NADH) small chain